MVRVRVWASASARVNARVVFRVRVMASARAKFSASVSVRVMTTVVVGLWLGLC
jgi:hypothetical protein